MSTSPDRLKIYVDADACPVKQEVVRVAERHGAPVYFVANAWMRLPESLLVNRIGVPDGLDEADNWIAERAGPGDIAVTADIGLAARCLENGALVIGPTGKKFSNDNIGMAVAMRDLNTELRETDALRGSNPAFTKADRSRFLQGLEQAVQDTKRGG